MMNTKSCNIISETIYNIIRKIEWARVSVYGCTLMCKGENNMSPVKDKVGNRYSGLLSWYQPISFDFLGK